MAYLLLFGAIFCVIILYFLMQVRNFIARERASENRIMTNLTMLNLEAESLTKNRTEPNTEPKAKTEKEDDGDEGDSLDLQELWGYPPDKQRVIEQIIPDDQVGVEDNWGYTIHIHESAEQYLGEEQFVGLEHRVASIPGVDKCQQKERGVFVINSNSYSPSILIELFWKEFLHVAEVASIKKNTL